MKTFEWPKDRERLERFFRPSPQSTPEVQETVRKILASVRNGGDKAVARFTRRFDGVALDPAMLEVPRRELRAAASKLDPEFRKALETAARRIRAFHKKQRLRGWTTQEDRFGRMELRVQPLRRVGVYAPGGKAAYPSTVLMNVIPAKVAGVDEIILASPPAPDGKPDPRTMGAAYLAGADRVFGVGGAQAIAALAYGTESIPRVDKIVGPGNAYVTVAKQFVFGAVDIDMIAGPTEILVIADDTANLDWVAADMLAQAEHDEDASSIAILIGCGKGGATELRSQIRKRLRKLDRRAIASASIARNAAIVSVRTANQAVALANLKAPEHVEVIARGARGIAKRIRNAGAIFIGPYTPEPVGDYIAGPNHTLPTAGTARFFSPLSVWSFYKTCHTIETTRRGLERFAPAIVTLAEAEGLGGHAESVRARFSDST